MALPTLADVRAYLKVPATQLPDVDLQTMLDAALADQLARCRWGTMVAPDDPDTYPAALRMGLLRRVQREAAARNLPLGMVGLDAAEFGPTKLPQIDALVDEHERAYRRMVVA